MCSQFNSIDLYPTNVTFSIKNQKNEKIILFIGGHNGDFTFKTDYNVKSTIF